MTKRTIINKGDIYGRLTITKELAFEGKRYENKLYECKCECGTHVKVKHRYLLTGGTRSCGCLAKDLTKARSITHGLYKHPLYSIHHGMKDRCYNPNATWYESYGGRGIKVCKEWRGKDGFVKFYKWNQSLPKSKQWKQGLEIDRKDNNGNYEPKNCRWRSRKQNANNRRDTVYVTYRNKRYTFSELYDRYGHSSVDYKLALKRYRQDNRELLDALTTPKRMFTRPDRI